MVIAVAAAAVMPISAPSLSWRIPKGLPVPLPVMNASSSASDILRANSAVIYDGKAFTTPYLSIQLKDDNATQRARNDSKERILSFIKDALRIVTGYGQKVEKDELTRASLSVDFLVRELKI